MGIKTVISLLEQALEILKGLSISSEPVAVEENGPELIWGSKVSSIFKERVEWIASDLGFDPNWLMAAMAFESGETFSSKIRNAAGSGAIGLIQFMPTTLKLLGTDVSEAGALSSEDQLKLVYKYFRPFKGKISNLDDLYMAILWPAAVGKPSTYNLFIKGGVAYRQNAGLDSDKNGYITKAEAAAKVRAKYEKGKKYKG